MLHIIALKRTHFKAAWGYLEKYVIRTHGNAQPSDARFIRSQTNEENDLQSQRGSPHLGDLRCEIVSSRKCTAALNFYETLSFHQQQRVYREESQILG